jgi:hypothetical protein
MKDSTSSSWRRIFTKSSAGPHFIKGIAERILDLLSILQAIAQETNPDSSLTESGMNLLQQHFVGEKAAFSDESDSNKNAFRNALTFVDPSDPSRPLFCPWHGKVKNQQFRIHFEWKRPTGQ